MKGNSENDQLLNDFSQAISSDGSGTYQSILDRAVALSQIPPSAAVFDQLALLWTEVAVLGLVDEEIAMKHIGFMWEVADRMREENKN
ncbi:hypothetical protein GYA49_05385 [Candidatus Beckwithbacteria bacterium]|nr:hypothetical protein [Candidatus Beckwithbacteria bacterium]